MLTFCVFHVFSVGEGNWRKENGEKFKTNVNFLLIGSKKTKKDGFWERKSLKIRLSMVGIIVQIPPECDDIFFFTSVKRHKNGPEVT